MRAVELTPGAACTGRFRGVFAGVGSMPEAGIVVEAWSLERKGAELGAAGEMPRAEAAWAVAVSFRRPDTLLLDVGSESLPFFFFGEDCTDGGGEKVCRWPLGCVRLEVGGVSADVVSE